jgi:hypothetical protein
MIKVELNPDFHGPNIIECEAILQSVEGAIELRWENSKPELHLLELNSSRDFILHVKDLSTLEKTINSTGQFLSFDPELIEAAKKSLINEQTYDWRNFFASIGQNATKGIIVKITADALRKGLRPKLTSVTLKCLHRGVSPIDVDVLLRIKALKGR